MFKTALKNNSYADNIGMASSSLCLVHCIITPFVFTAQICMSSCCANSPPWWKAIDFLFLIISFIAIYFASKQSSKPWVKRTFYILFGTFTVLTINHHIGIVKLPLELNYIPAFLLFSLHLYNRKDCKCRSHSC